MIVVKPETITDTKLISSNVPEDEAPMWVNGTDSVVDAMVIYAHEVYRAKLTVTGANNTIPPPDLPNYWELLGATNRWRAFDAKIGSQTQNLGTIDFTLQSGGLVDSVGVLNAFGLTVRIIETDPFAGVVHDQTYALLDVSEIDSWWDYFFAPVTEMSTELVVLDLPDYAGATIRIIIDAGTSTAKLGECLIGPKRDMGKTLAGSSFGTKDFSTKETDKFGDFIVIKRDFARTADFDIALDRSLASSIKRYMENSLTTPMLFIGSVDEEFTFAYGFYFDFKIVTNMGPWLVGCNLRVEGLT